MTITELIPDLDTRKQVDLKLPCMVQLGSGDLCPATATWARLCSQCWDSVTVCNEHRIEINLRIATGWAHWCMFCMTPVIIPVGWFPL
jgi:hypothetical protein